MAQHMEVNSCLFHNCTKGCQVTGEHSDATIRPERARARADEVSLMQSIAPELELR
ncbi:hypothetical protein MTY_0186 [Moorella thermoacetica Y72]|uniref:Uncharacterized protein n=1 Tax=Moorella thermoacetica Y72 TaxID=1325331 RepID=A0A0S6U799_NEOTH|nr:hypothetical protein MTY_0186 [Moorella thermoacetica Y72]